MNKLVIILGIILFGLLRTPAWEWYIGRYKKQEPFSTRGWLFWFCKHL